MFYKINIRRTWKVWCPGVQTECLDAQTHPSDLGGGSQTDPESGSLWKLLLISITEKVRKTRHADTLAFATRW